MRWVVVALTIILACCGAQAADSDAGRPEPQPVPQAQQASEPSAPAQKPSDDTRLELNKPEGETPKADQSWWQKLLRDLPNCKSFSDGCRTCSDSHVCSNIGIACQPKEWACNDANRDVKPEVKPDAKPDARQ